jgi:hypothetical protein
MGLDIVFIRISRRCLRAQAPDSTNGIGNAVHPEVLRSGKGILSACR